MDTCTCVAKSLCCPPETVTTLFIGFIPIQNKNVKKEIRYEGARSPRDKKKTMHRDTEIRIGRQIPQTEKNHHGSDLG